MDSVEPVAATKKTTTAEVESYRYGGYLWLVTWIILVLQSFCIILITVDSICLRNEFHTHQSILTSMQRDIALLKRRHQALVLRTTQLLVVRSRSEDPPLVPISRCCNACCATNTVPNFRISPPSPVIQTEIRADEEDVPPFPAEVVYQLPRDVTSTFHPETTTGSEDLSLASGWHCVDKPGGGTICRRRSAAPSH